MTDLAAGNGNLRAVPHGLPTAVWGMLVFVAAEATLFACFVATYFYLRLETPVWPPLGVPEPRVVVPLILLAALVATSIPMQLASLRARAGQARSALALVLVALVVQCGYLAYQLHDFRDQLHRVEISENAYTSIYYVLLGADHAHVLVGVLFSLWLAAKLARGLTTYRVNATQAIAWYWHAVNAITVVVVAVLLSARA